MQKGARDERTHHLKCCDDVGVFVSSKDTEQFTCKEEKRENKAFFCGIGFAEAQFFRPRTCEYTAIFKAEKRKEQHQTSGQMRACERSEQGAANDEQQADTLKKLNLFHKTHFKKLNLFHKTQFKKLNLFHKLWLLLRGCCVVVGLV